MPTTETKQSNSTVPAYALKVPRGTALQALLALQKLSAATFPAKEAFVIAKALAKLRSNADVIATDEARRAAATRHGTDNGQGGTTVPPEKLADFIAEYEPIASQVIELDIQPLPLSILESAPSMTPEDMAALQSFFAEE